MGRALRELHNHGTQNVAEIITNHVTFELEAIDRMYLNAYVRRCKRAAASSTSSRPSSAPRPIDDRWSPRSAERFVEAIERFVATAGTRLGDL